MLGWLGRGLGIRIERVVGLWGWRGGSGGSGEVWMWKLVMGCG